MNLEQKKSTARKASVVEHLGKIQASLVNFSLIGFHLEEDLRLDHVMKALRELDTAVDEFMENHGAKKNEETKEE